jgi:hypothetical protein
MSEGRGAGHCTSPADADLGSALRARLDAVIGEGREIFRRFDAEVRGESFHPFVAADYERVLAALWALRGPGLRFLELGSASGVITILADLLGFDACGIELAEELVEGARGLARRHGSGARFAAGSFFPAGYRFRDSDGDARIGTLGYGAPAYAALGRQLADFDVVYGYPWDGEGPILHDLMHRHGAPGARLVVLSGSDGVRVFRDGVPEG